MGLAGIGGSLSRKLVASGRRVHLVGRDASRVRAHADALEALTSPKQSSGTRFVTSSVCDVADLEALEALGESLKREGDISGFVFAAGSIPLAPLKSISARTMLDAFTLNTLAPVLLLKHLATGLAAGGAAAPGSAVFFSSVAATTGFRNHTAIATAKAGLEGFVRSAAADLAPSVRVNAIAPSLTETPLAARLTANSTTRQALASAHPLGRLGTADDLATAALFLLDASWVTGQVLAVDGGRSTLRLA